MPNTTQAADYSTPLSEKRTALAVERSFLAFERTLMAWLRTSLSMGWVKQWNLAFWIAGLVAILGAFAFASLVLEW